MNHAQFRELLESQTRYYNGDPNQQVSILLDEFDKLPDVAAEIENLEMNLKEARNRIRELVEANTALKDWLDEKK